jgi:uncharacterized protein
MKIMKKDGRFSRRDFLKTGPAALAVAAATPAWLSARSVGGSALEYRVLGRTGLRVTTVSLGCMVAPEEIITAAVDRGVNWLDTAHGYKNGQNEGEVGRAMKGRRDSAYISTKLRAGNKETMKSQIDISLTRLQTDYVDNLMIHDVRNRAQVFNETNMEVLQEAKDAGKTRFVGFSTHNGMAEAINAAVDAEFYDIILTSFNFSNANPALLEAVARAHGAGIGIIAMKTQLGDFPNPQGGLTPHQAALKWVLESEHVTCAVPGTRDFQQLDLNLAVMGERLGYFEGRELERYALATAGLRCTDCGNCVAACPSGVDVRDVRRCAMYLDGYRDPSLARDSYRQLALNARPCVDCAECTVTCTAAASALQPILSRTHMQLA